MTSSHIKLDICICLRKHDDLFAVSYGPIGPVVLIKPIYRRMSAGLLQEIIQWDTVYSQKNNAS